jgi:tetratricopeptide (TPR) repeat protein
MELRDIATIATITISVAALGLSVYATITAQKKSLDERTRTIRTQLTDVLGRLTSLYIEAAKLAHEAKDDHQYLDSLSTALNQQNGFLLEQAVYLSKQIPALVTTYEFNTIAVADTNAGNLIRAEDYQRRAIDVAPTDLYKSQAVRGYAVFLYPQGRLNEGREQFRRALDLLKGEDNLVHSTKGYTYQMWALNERHFARSPERANELFENARKEYGAIDVEFVRNYAIARLDTVRTSGQPPTASELLKSAGA